MSRHRLAIAAVTAVFAWSWCATAAAEVTADAHAALQEWQFSTAAVAVSGVSWTTDDAGWHLETGSVRFMRPTAGGAVTGFVFEGRGRFTLAIADPFELDQLRRFAGDPSLQGVDLRFSRMVFRTSGALPPGLEPAAGNAAFQPDGLARDRHEKWLHQARHDVDARVLAGLSVAGDDYVLADMDTDGFGWLMVEIEPWRDEEINLVRLAQLNEFVEVWVSLDLGTERLPDGGPGPRHSAPADLVHVDVEVDLSDHKGSRVTRTLAPDPDWAHFRTTVTVEAIRDGLGALQLDLNPRAEITGATSPDGLPLEVVRDHIGARFLGLSKELWDGTVTVLLGAPLAAGERCRVTLDYDLEIYNYASGGSWYPQVAHSVNDLHTARLQALPASGLELWAVGDRADGPAPKGPQWEIWEITEPTTMIGFTFGKGFKEERLRVRGLPEVVVLGDPAGFGGSKKLRNVGADVINSLNFYKQYFGFELPVDRIYATAITAGHGQAFSGFLHLSQYTFEAEHPGASELFRAHEVAHQMWGHTVMWRSYRDQWLSEAFAEYSAMLYVKASMPDKPYFDQIVEVYTAEQLGSFKSSMSKFARPWDVDRVRVEGDELGPIAAGYRAGTARIPNGGVIQLYRKGPLFLHMIHEVLQVLAPPGQDPFRDVMTQFLVEYSGREASTEDFKAVLERVSGKDWDALFDSWVYGCGIPTYEWGWRVEQGPEGPVLEVQVTQSDVPEGFTSVVPIRITLSGNRHGINLLPVDKSEQTFRIALPEKPADVELDPGRAVPARVKKRG